MDLIYHERQSRQLCALHVLNNLLQEKAFTKAQLDSLCLELSPSNWWNPHRSPIGLGNYDVNVMMAALQTKNLQAIWFDKRKTVHNINPSAALGFILNVPSSSVLTSWLPFCSNKHWIAIRQIGDELYFNLDSHLHEPQVLGNEQDLLSYFEAELSKDDRELLIVVDSSSLEAAANLWKN